MNDKELMKKLKEVFIQEAKERLSSMSSNLILLEQDGMSSEQMPLFEDVYRDAHSLKGASRSIGLSAIESIFQIVEDIFNDVKDGDSTLSSELFDLLHDFIKTLNAIIDSTEIESQENNKKLKEIEAVLVDYISGETESASDVLNGDSDYLKPGLDVNYDELLSDDIIEEDSLENTIEDSSAEDGFEPEEVVVKQSEPSDVDNNEKEVDEIPVMKEKKVEADKAEKVNVNSKKSIKVNSDTEEPEKIKVSSNQHETVRIPSEKLDSLLLKSENMIRIKQMFHEHIPYLSEALTMLGEYKKTSSGISADYLAVKQDLIDTKGEDRRKGRKSIERIIGCIEYYNNNFKLLENLLKNLLNTEKENHRNTEKIVDSFLYDVKEIAMLPFSNILYAFPIMVREISKKLSKNIRFVMKGDEIKLDRRILQEIKDPLIHIIRNSIDHGIESEEERLKSGKPKEGLVELNISQMSGNKILVRIRDDGGGIDTEVIKHKIINNNLMTVNELDQLEDNDLLSYIFHSGFSTKNIITDLSGRGLGMAIVKDKIDSLGGNVIVNTEKGTYSEIQIILPVTLATFKGVLVESSSKKYIIPSISLEEAVRVEANAVKTVESRRTIHYNTTTYPLIKLTRLLGINEIDKKDDSKYITVAIISKSNELMALELDEVVEEQEILIKSLGSQLKKVNNISGATILNSGEIVPILNIHDLFSTAKNISYSEQKGFSPGISKKSKDISPAKRTLLIAEDSVTSRILIKNILESAGYKTETAVDGMDALTILKTKNIDLVVSDVEMPRMDGFTLTSQIRAEKKYSELPVILVTSRSTPEDKQKGADAGANAYIVKSDFDQTTLIDTIKTLI